MPRRARPSVRVEIEWWEDGRCCAWFAWFVIAGIKGTRIGQSGFDFANVAEAFDDFRDWLRVAVPDRVVSRTLRLRPSDVPAAVPA